MGAPEQGSGCAYTHDGKLTICGNNPAMSCLFTYSVRETELEKAIGFGRWPRHVPELTFIE